eukprot:CAMPEP_0203893114 /NCGR_PEP_ID=MMETSP0359-20131031/36230_1 /ASSEMBLY_ACC=CAM_ASM_000338 /TAXON_ID=268821 /ORGANISM="Scrippsiella Hangoei, Strain SHTV-5" /LENGTH=189 /DNA_ID=CAMNT_0050815211 /DNA_START=15 /DNA_END=580 /DNA_ORIENTATION=+
MAPLHRALLFACLVGPCSSAKTMQPQISDRLGSDGRGVLFAKLHEVLSRGNYTFWHSTTQWFSDHCTNGTVASWISCPSLQPYDEFRYLTRQNLSSGPGGPPGRVATTTCSPGSEALAFNRMTGILERGEEPRFYRDCKVDGVNLTNVFVAIADATRVLYAAYGATHYDGYNTIGPFEQVRRWTFDAQG